MRVALSHPLKLSRIAEFASTSAYGLNKATITHICTDSRELRRGDLYIALSGKKFDGCSFLRVAKEIGAYTLSVKKENTDICVSDSRIALLRIAEMYKNELTDLKFTAAITGSVGKTTTKEMLYGLLSLSYSAHKTSGNLNNDIGLPMTILSSASDCEAMVLEIGMNHAGEISVLSKCAKPDVGIITNIGTSHIGNLGSREAIAEEKSKISEGMNKQGLIICEYKEPLLKKITNRVSVSTKHDGADYYLSDISHDNYGFIFSINHNGRKEVDIKIPLHDEFLLTNALMAIVAAFLSGIDFATIRKGCSVIGENCTRPKLTNCGAIRIIDDSYNASPESVRASLKMLKRIGKNNCSCVLGDMLELGEHSEKLHRDVGKFAAECGLSSLYLVGKYCNYYEEGALSSGFDPQKIYINDTLDPSITVRQILSGCKEGETLLFKASNSTNLSEIIKVVERRMGETK